MATFDGRPPIYRKLWRQEAASYAAHLRRLELDDRRARFMGAVDRRVARRHVDGIDWTEAVVIGAWVGPTLRAVGELRWHCGPTGREAEIAITVERRFQDQGIGTELLRRLITAARNRAIRRVHLVCMAENPRARRLVERLGGALSCELGQADGVLETLPPTFATLIAESLEDGDTALAGLRTALGGLYRAALPRAARRGAS
jgi:ribosomal protein S18 acetylase RimI-like enzyme